MNNKKKVHIIGIKGMGTSSLAVIYSEKGYKVSGSDEAKTSVADYLLSKHPDIEIYNNFSEKHLDNVDIVIRSVAYSDNNLEVAAAKKKNLPILTYPQAVGQILKDYSTIAVAGCNGKTTTSGMLSQILSDANLSPSYIVGGGLQNGSDNAKIGTSKYFLVEADEYRDAFLNYSSTAENIIITNIDHDHPDYFPTFEDVIASYKKFIEDSPKNSNILVCGDDKGNKILISKTQRKIETYGLSPNNDWVLKVLSADDKGTSFLINRGHDTFGEFETPLPGTHNLLNAGAAAITAIRLGVEKESIATSLRQFKGAKRRFETLYETDNITIIDDYAHHPSAIDVTLAGTRQKFPDRKLIAIFQPHTYSRTLKLLNDFSKSLALADQVILMDIYPSVREKPEEFPVSIGDLAKLILPLNNTVKIVNDLLEVETIITSDKKPKVIITMGAGDIADIMGRPLANKLAKIHG